MEKVLKVLKKERTEYALVGLLVFFVLFNVQLPECVGSLVDTLLGRVVVLGAAISLLFVHPVLGAVALVAAYMLVHRAEKSTGNYQVRHFVPSEFTKNKELNAFNQFPVTLEEEVVHKMVPYVNEGPMSPPSYKPTQDKLHDAAKL
jgi:hypothetical protein